MEIRVYERNVAERTKWRNFRYRTKWESAVVIDEKIYQLYGSAELKNPRLRVPYERKFSCRSLEELKEYSQNLKYNGKENEQLKCNIDYALDEFSKEGK